MLLLLKFVAKIFSVLNGEVSPRQISAGLAFGAMIGLLPMKGLLPVLLLLLAFLINFNLSAVFLGSAVFKLISFAIDPVANQVGFFLLVQVSALKGFWTAFYNMAVVPYTNYNNTIVLGSLAVGILAFLPLYFITGWAVIRYRTRWKEKFLKLKIVQIVKASTFYKFYLAYKGIRGE